MQACPQHTQTNDTLLAGHIIVGKRGIIATMHGSFLCASLEIGMLRRALMYACELHQAQPRAPARLHAPRTPLHRQGSVPRQQSSSDEYPQEAPVTGPNQASVASAPAPAVPAKPSVKRNLTVQVFLHCARIDVSFPCLVHFRLACCMVADAALSSSCSAASVAMPAKRTRSTVFDMLLEQLTMHSKMSTICPRACNACTDTATSKRLRGSSSLQELHICCS